MTLFTLVQNLLHAAPVIAALLLLRVVNVPRARRHQQWFMPLVSAVYAVLALVVFYRFNDWFDGVLERLFDLLPLLAPLYQTHWLYIIENTLVLLVFFALKWVLARTIAPLFKGDRFFGVWAVEQFFEYDAAAGRWFVRERLSKVRSFYRVLFWTSLALTAALIMLMSAYPAWPVFTAISFPAIAALVLGEVWYAMCGDTALEAQNRFAGTGAGHQRIVDYAALREVYRSLFGKRIIDEGVDLSNPYSLSTSEALRDLQNSSDETERLFGDYFATLKRGGVPLEESLMYASLDVLNGTSTLINNPFAHDLTPYLSLPSYIRMLGGGKCLIISGRDSSAGALVEWFEQGLEQISGVPELWNAQVLNTTEQEGLDVGVIRSADLHNRELLAENDEFFAEVETVIIVEPSRLLATAQLGLGLVVARLARGNPPVYVAFDRNHDGLVDSLSHLLKVSLTDVVATQQSTGASSDLVWQAEGEHLAPALMPGVARYLGVGTELAAVAMKYHVDEVEWIGGDSFPVTDMAWIAGQYYPQITGFAEMDLSQRALSSSLRTTPNPLDAQRSQHRFLVVEDELRNVYESLRLFGSRSTESGFVNLISENYLMRDYMIDNRELFAADPKAIPAFVPDFARTARNAALRLLLHLSTVPASLASIGRELELIGNVSQPEGDDQPAEPPALKLLAELLGTHLDLHGIEFVRSTSREQREGGDPEQREVAYYSIKKSDSVVRQLNRLSSAYFLVEDETEDRDFVGGCLREHLPQTVLPGQFLTVGGKYYEVLSIGSGEHDDEVVLRRAAEHITGRPSYRHLRNFQIRSAVAASTSAPVQETLRPQSVGVQRISVSMSAETTGYLETEHRGDLNDPRRVLVSGLPRREFVAKEAIRIDLHGAAPEVASTVAVLLNELFVTVFPHSHGFVAALVEDAAGDFERLLPGLELSEGVDEHHESDVSSVYVVEDSLVDLGLVSAVERNWQRLFEVISDYLAWVDSEPSRSEERPQGAPVFEGETEADVAERERLAAEAETRGGYDAPQHPGIRGRFVRWIRRIFGRRPEPEPDAEPGDERSGEVAAAEPGFEKPLEASLVVPASGDPGSSAAQEVPAEPGQDPDAEVLADPAAAAFDESRPDAPDERTEPSEKGRP